MARRNDRSFNQPRNREKFNRKITLFVQQNNRRQLTERVSYNNFNYKLEEILDITRNNDDEYYYSLRVGETYFTLNDRTRNILQDL